MPDWVDYFYSLEHHLAEPSNEPAANSIAFAMHNYSCFIPKNALIIGKVSGANLLLLRLSGNRRGRVDLKILLESGFYNVDPKDIDRESGVQQVASSFNDFLSILKESDAFDWSEFE